MRTFLTPESDHLRKEFRDQPPETKADARAQRDEAVNLAGQFEDDRAGLLEALRACEDLAAFEGSPTKYVELKDKATALMAAQAKRFPRELNPVTRRA